MTELTRLLDDSSEHPAARALLRSAERDEPPAHSLAAAAAALGIGSALSGTAAAVTSAATTALPSASSSAMGTAGTGALLASSGSTPITLALLVKHVGIGVVAGAVAMGGLTYAVDSEKAPVALPSSEDASLTMRHSDSRHAVDRDSALASVDGSIDETLLPGEGEPAVVRSDAPLRPIAGGQGTRHPSPAKRVETAPLHGGSALPKPTAAFALVPEIPAAAQQSDSPKDVSADKEPNRQLALEVALLDRARQALLARDSATALSVLDEYGSRTRTGILEQEVQVLRIRALLESGDRSSAARLARRFVTRHPESRHAESLQALAADSP